MKLVTVTAPAEEPITLAEAKLHLRVEIDEDDNPITAWITTARIAVEYFTQRALTTQTFDLYLDQFPDGNYIKLPRPPLQSVTWVKYTDDEGNVYTLPSSQYVVDVYGEPGRVVLKNGYSWPTTELQVVNGVQVRFVAGYGAAANVPESFKSAMYLKIGDLYENRENTVIQPGAVPTSLPAGAESLLWFDRFIYSF